MNIMILFPIYIIISTAIIVFLLISIWESLFTFLLKIKINLMKQELKISMITKKSKIKRKINAIEEYLR